MKQCLSTAIFFGLTLAVFSSGQNAEHPSETQPEMGDMPGMRGEKAGTHTTPPQAPGTSTRPTGPEMPTPDLLQEAFTRPALRVSQFEQWAAALNPTLRQAELSVRQSLEQAHQVGLLPNPSIGYEGDQIRGGAYGGGEQGSFVQQTFVLGGKLGLRRKVYVQQARERRFGVDEQRYRVLTDVQQSFYRALAAQQLVQVRQHLLKLSADAVVAAHQLSNVGQADAPDVLQAEVEQEQAQDDYITAQHAFLQEFHVLAALAGKPGILVAPLQGQLDRAPQIDTDQIVEEIARNSPSVKRARQDVARAEAALKSAQRDVVPDLTVRGGLQQNYEPVNGLGTPVGVQAFAVASINLPIFNRSQGNVAGAEAEVERAQAEVERIQLSLRQRSEPLIQTYLVSQAQARRYSTEMIPRAERAYQLYSDRYQSMAAAYPQVLVSQRTLFQLQVAYISVLEKLWTNALALQGYLLNGGLTSAVPSGAFSTEINVPTGADGNSH